jgi:PAS domain S-box-containing protein
VDAAGRSLQRELKKFRVLYDLAVAMTAERSLEENLQLVVEKSRELLETDTAYIALRDEARGDVYMHSFSGIRTESFKMMRLPFGKGLGGLVAKTRRGIIVEDYLGEKGIAHIVDTTVAEEGVNSGIAVPVQIGQINLGVLYAFNRKSTSFSQADLETLHLIGNLAAVEISRKRAEDSARQSRIALEGERRYRELVEGSRDGYAMTGMDGKIVESNTSFRNMLGYTEEELRKLTDRDITPEAWHAQETQIVRNQLLDRGYTEVFEKEYIRKDGTVFHAETRVYLAKDDKGENIGAWALIRDTTERRRTEQDLRESERKFRDLFENVSDFIYFHDLEGNFIETNLAFKRAYGAEDEPSGSFNIRDMMPEKNRHLLGQYRNRLMTNGHDEGFMQTLTRDGREVLIEYKNGLVRDPDGNVLGVRGSARDVTDRVLAEREKKALQAQILSAQRIEAIGTLAGGIAHNFNNLLMGIQGNATLARLEVNPSGPVSRKLENIEKLVKSGAKLTSQLLGYARGGRYEVRPVSLNDFVKEISNTFAQARKDITVQLDLSEALKGIEADQGQMEQAILNLLVNAADAMPSGGNVILRTRNVSHETMIGRPYKPKPGDYVLLEVQDFGTGMDRTTMGRIFEPFFTTKGMGKGTGLGLASVYGIVKGHGGYIDVASREQEGSTFQIHLPASEKTIVKEKEIPDGVIMGSGTILLVDDEEMILEVGKGMLETLGYSVLASGGGREAVEIYRRDHSGIDLVVLDLVMPDMGGRETYEQMRSINPGVRVLLSSGFSLDSLAKEMLTYGCDGFIQKPFFIQEFSQEVAKILSVR